MFRLVTAQVLTLIKHYKPKWVSAYVICSPLVHSLGGGDSSAPDNIHSKGGGPSVNTLSRPSLRFETLTLDLALQLSTISVRLLQTLEKFRNDQIKKVKVRE